MKTSFCLLNNYQNLKELLVKELFYSSNIVKKKVPKKYLEKKLLKGDIIELDIDLVNNNLLSAKYAGPSVEIIFEDDVLLAVNKPAGVHGHPLEYSESNTILNFIRESRDFNFLGKKSDNKERGLLYRLDELTSGLMIFVKDEQLHSQLREDFSKCVKRKTYLALVSGELNIDKEVTNFLEGSGLKGSKVIESEKGVKCTSHMKTLKKVGDCSLIKIELETGFRHQIRVQLSLLGHPIMGDTLYGAIPAQRMYLHALSYDFNVDQREYSLSAESDELFCNFLNTDSLTKML